MGKVWVGEQDINILDPGCKRARKKESKPSRNTINHLRVEENIDEDIWGV